MVKRISIYICFLIFAQTLNAQELRLGEDFVLVVRIVTNQNKADYINKQLEREDLSVAKVLEECKSHYKYLKSRGKWYPVLGVTNSATPKIFSSNAEKNMNIAQVMALMANF